MPALRQEFLPISDEEFNHRQEARAALTFKECQEKDLQLLEAAYDGKGSEGLLALRLGANPDAVDQNGFSGLMHASSKGYDIFVSILLAGRADPLLEAPAILKNGHIVPKQKDIYTPQYGDVTITAPLLAIINCRSSVLRSYTNFGIEIPEYWREVFINAAHDFTRNHPGKARSSIIYNTRKLLRVSRLG